MRITCVSRRTDGIEEGESRGPDGATTEPVLEKSVLARLYVDSILHKINIEDYTYNSYTCSCYKIFIYFLFATNLHFFLLVLSIHMRPLFAP